MRSNRAMRRAAVAQSRKQQSWTWITCPIDPTLFHDYPAVRNVRAVVRNDFWMVQFYDVRTDLGDMLHLAIRSVQGCENAQRTGLEPRWRDLQRIKDELVGKDREAVQVYPRHDHITNSADMYHLFVLPEGWPLPFGLHRENGFVRD